MQFLLTLLLCWLWPAPYKPTPEMRAMHRAHLEIRSEYELPAQRLDPHCCQIAQKWAEYLAATGRFHHGAIDFHMLVKSRKNKNREIVLISKLSSRYVSSISFNFIFLSLVFLDSRRICFSSSEKGEIIQSALIVCSLDSPNKAEITAVEAIFTNTTWSNPTLLKLFSKASTPWISWAFIMLIKTSCIVKPAFPEAIFR